MLKINCVVCLVLLGCVACLGGGDDSTAISEPVVPPDPVADAGLNQIALLNSQVTVFGGRSAGRSLSYEWSMVSTPADSVAILDGDGDIVTFVADRLGTYTVSLAVSDGVMTSQAVSVDIEVIAARSLLQDGTANGYWPVYGGNQSSSKYSPVNEINAANVDQLVQAWRWQSPDNQLTHLQNFVFEPTPLMVDGVLYTSTSFSQVAAIDALTGETLWVYDPKSYESGRPPNNGFTHRGVSYDEQNGQKVIYMPTGDARLIAINAVSGKPINTFGSIGNGVVNLLEGIPRLNESTTRLGLVHNLPGSPVENPTEIIQVGNTSPGTICNNVLVVGSGVHDGEVLPPSPPGDVRGFDVATGQLLWTFHTVPRAGEFGVDTWGNDSWQENGNTNVWAPMSADEDLGLVYLPVSGATNNYYGGRRPGDNLFANCIVALDCATGAREWHYQTIHHDIWDYDLPAAPNLIDITVNGVPTLALAQVSKQGFIYVLNREDGTPVWPIVETAVPASSVPGEVTSPTQPIPTKPAPFVRQGTIRSDFIDQASIAAYDVGPIYTPPSLDGLVVTPGEGGGANWGGASFDPTTQILYVTGFGPLTYIVQLLAGNEANFYYTFPRPIFGPSTPSPYPGNGSEIVAYDMNTGDTLWQLPGDSSGSVIGNSATMIAGDLLFYKNSNLLTLNALDKTNGQLLHSIPLNGRPTAVPMTYVWEGKQYIAVAIERNGGAMEIVAFTLP